MTAILLKDPDIFRTCFERTVRLIKRAGEWLGDDVFHANVGRLPPTVRFEATVQPVDVSIGSRKSSNLFCGREVRNSWRRDVAQDILDARISPQRVDLTLMMSVSGV